MISYIKRALLTVLFMPIEVLSQDACTYKCEYKQLFIVSPWRNSKTELYVDTYKWGENIFIFSWGWRKLRQQNSSGNKSKQLKNRGKNFWEEKKLRTFPSEMIHPKEFIRRHTVYGRKYLILIKNGSALFSFTTLLKIQKKRQRLWTDWICVRANFLLVRIFYGKLQQNTKLEII